MSASTIASRLCLGTAQLGLNYGVANTRGRPDDAACERLLSRAVEHGILRLDTASAYGDAEQRIGSFLANCDRRDEVQVVSKLSPPPVDLQTTQVFDWVTSQINTTLRNLQIECLAAWLIHDADTVRKYSDAIWDAMSAQVDRGVTKQIGLSVYDQAEFRLAQRQSVAIQLPMNLLDHRFSASGELRAAAQREDTIYARSVLLQGVLTMQPSELPEQLRHLATPLGTLHEMLGGWRLTPIDVALAFVLSHQEVDFAVIGVDDASQLDENLTRAEVAFPDGLADELVDAFKELPVKVVEPRRW